MIVVAWLQAADKHRPSCFPFSQQDGGESWKDKNEKNSWIEIKTVQYVNKKGGEYPQNKSLMQRQSLTTLHQQTDAHTACVQRLLWKNIPSVFIIAWNIPLVQLSQLCLSQSFAQPQPTRWGRAWKIKKVSVPCKHCSTIAEIFVGYQYRFSQKSKTQHFMG